MTRDGMYLLTAWVFLLAFCATVWAFAAYGIYEFIHAV